MIDNLKKSIDNTKNENVAENVFKEIDDIEKQIVKENEKKLKEILPKAFAVVKETAIRFKNNKEIIVNATEFDIELSQKKDLVKINGDKAIYIKKATTFWCIHELKFVII